jgi:hypothetical protein
MGYSTFKKIRTVVKKFSLDSQLETLFGNILSVKPSEWLVETLRIAHIMPLTNEKTKSERIVSPILLEITKSYTENITFFSGESIDVDISQDLSGPCDFFFSLQKPKPYMEAPIISIVESKDEDMEWGVAQCAAQMYGAQCFNEAENKSVPFLYGCATDGVEWQFLRFEKNIFYIDQKIYTHLPEILGIWHQIIKLYL